MSNQASSGGKGKGRADFIDLTADVPFSSSGAAQIRLPSPVTPPLNPRPTSSTLDITGPSSSTPYSSSFSLTQGTKRKAQQTRITSFFPAKKSRIEIIPTPPTPKEKRAAKEAEKVAKEEEKNARAEAKRLVRALEKEERDVRKSREDAAKAARAKERRLKKEARDAEAAVKREKMQWKSDWKNWVQQNTQPEAEFKIPKDEDMWEHHVNLKDSKRFGLNRNELFCLPHCDVKNPAEPAGEEYAPMKLYVLNDVERLACRKEAILNGISQNDEAVLLQEGKRLLKIKMEKEDKEHVKQDER